MVRFSLRPGLELGVSDFTRERGSDVNTLSDGMVVVGLGTESSLRSRTPDTGYRIEDWSEVGGGESWVSRSDDRGL